MRYLGSSKAWIFLDRKIRIRSRRGRPRKAISAGRESTRSLKHLSSRNNQPSKGLLD
jgi:hypothetical protein